MNFRATAFLSIIPVTLGVLAACSSDAASTTPATTTGDAGAAAAQATAGDPAAVLEAYATNLYAAYGAAVTDEATFSTAADAFVAAPTAAGLTALQTAWLASRANYMLTEGARFYDGPIDVAPVNHEALVNSWPLDEAYIDYTTDKTTLAVDDTVGFVNSPSLMANITVAAIDAAHAEGGDDHISDGWHALEFLLWGQALDTVGPGKRAHTDYILGGVRPNADRRGTYLKATVSGISTHLIAVHDAWAPAAKYRTSFTAGGYTSIGKIFSGLGRFSKGELASQRINAAYESKDRRDQHDCFSSETLTDYDRDARGVLAIYTGTLGGGSGLGVSSLVAKVNPTLDTQIKAAIQASIDAVNAIPKPFEASIAGDDSSAGRTAIRNAVVKLRAQGDLFAEAATALGLTVAVPDSND